ncbi:MAG: DUF4296 domain-containing protein [Bacteroidetes bacterium]|nr:DUF4296 domain-containing protein [Bacteroidota bacterium]
MKLRYQILKLLFLLSPAFCCWQSCKSDKVVIPSGIIAEDTMIIVLADVHLAEAKLLLIGKYLNDENLKSSYIQHALSRSKIDTARFNKSFAFYSSKPELFSVMYEKVMAEISKRQAEKK